MKRIKNSMATLVFVGSFIYGGHVSAQEIRVPSAAQQTENIISVVTKYGQSIGCMDVAPTANDIFAMTPFKTYDDLFEAKFAVLWVGDIGCSGGSDTTTTNVAIVKVGAGSNFYVDVLQSDPVTYLPVGRIEKIISAGKDILVLDSIQHADGDAKNYPTIRERVTLKLLGYGKWQVLNVKPMPSVEY